MNNLDANSLDARNDPNLASGNASGDASGDPARPWPWIDPQTGLRHGGYRRVPHRTLILIRWMAVGGQLASLGVVHFLLQFSVPLLQTLLVIGASVVVNILALARRPRAGRLRDGEAAAYLGFDTVQLAALLFFTGGLANPFAILILAPVTVSATMLPRRATIGLAVLAVLSVSAIAVLHWPLPWSGDGLALPQIYVIGIWVAIVLGTVFIASYVGSLTLEGRRMQDALDATHMALSREQRHAAVGALAAAAAHELGSPLSTIAVTAKELARDPAIPETMGGDIDILLAEIERCRDILAELGQSKEFDPADPYSVLPLTAMIQAAVAQNDDPTRTIHLHPQARD
ncbi:MAG: sensor histidine kinase, partial [Alphaproteobacteria bacterium]|nr:sensor histidine kinase [Alphaproteobacteria bacterium]